eukprot:9788942-Alexandrium_andersonii.AAC.1
MEAFQFGLGLGRLEPVEPLKHEGDRVQGVAAVDRLHRASNDNATIHELAPVLTRSLTRTSAPTLTRPSHAEPDAKAYAEP